MFALCCRNGHELEGFHIRVDGADVKKVLLLPVIGLSLAHNLTYSNTSKTPFKLLMPEKCRSS